MEQQTIKCAFCKGTGKNPHFRGTCPVCKGKGRNQIVGPYIKCSDCKGSGRKSGTTLTCFGCKGLGVIADTREFVREARREMKQIQQEMEKEKEELYRKVTPVIPVKSKHGAVKPGKKKIKKSQREWEEKYGDARTYFCQSCAKKIPTHEAIKICLKCFRQLKKESL